MRKWIIKKINKFLGIDLLYRKLDFQLNELHELRAILKERTEYHVDVHQVRKHNSQIILIGKYRNMDFVKCYDIAYEEFNHLIHHCRDLEKYAHRGRIDAYPTLSSCIKYNI